jgi:hypothetical protein
MCHEQRRDTIERRRNTMIPVTVSGTFRRQCIAGLACVLACAAGAAAPVLVVGTGNPAIDIPAVQAAVTGGGEVSLQGHFSFSLPPTVPTATPWLGGLATIRVSKAVAISGTQDGDSGMTTIEGGTTPFYVESPGVSVTIEGLRFIRPTGDAIFVYSVGGLVIASNRIESVVPIQLGGSSVAEGIDVSTTSGAPPTPMNPGTPAKVSGALVIANNDINVGGTAQDATEGVLIFSVGTPAAEADAYVFGNRIRNTTEPGINVRYIGGRAYIEGNELNTGAVAAVALARPQAIRVVNSGAYVIAHNSIDCGWAQPDAQGIGVFSQFAQWPIERAIIVDNHVKMSAPVGTAFTSFSAGIAVYGFAQDNLVQDNGLEGMARAALLVSTFQGGAPDGTALVLNRFDDFAASAADVYVGTGAKNTRFVGAGTVTDLGTGTIVVPLPN